MEREPYLSAAVVLPTGLQQQGSLAPLSLPPPSTQAEREEASP